MSKKKSKPKYSLTKRIVGLTIFLNSLFLVAVVVIGLFIFSVNFTALKENSAISETNSTVKSTEIILQDLEYSADILSKSSAVIDFVSYINNGSNPEVTSGDAIFSTYEDVLLLMESVSTIDETDEHYVRVFLATDANCFVSIDGCMMDETGQVFSLANDYDLLNESWYEDIDTHVNILSRTYVDTITDENVITYVKRLFNDQSQQIGFVGLTMSISSFDYEFNEQLINENNKMILISSLNSETSLTYYSDPVYEDYLYKDISQFNSIDASLGFENEGLAYVISSKSEDLVSQKVFNDNYLVSYQTLEDYDIDVFVLIFDAQSISFEMILVFTLLFVIILIIVIGLIINHSTKQSLQPIHEIIHSIEEIKNGNYSVQVQVKENNEIKEIGDAINLMSKEIDRQITLVYESFAYDQLTGLKNKSAVANEINQELLKGDQKVAVCLLQVDNLKDIIIIKGQMMGDSLIKAIAEEIDSIISKHEMLYSNGGNELIYIIPNFVSLTEVRDKVNKIIYRFKSPIEVNHIKSEIKIYAGIATYPTDDHNLEDLIKKCDVSIYKDKSSERKQVIFYNDRISQEISYQAEVSEQLAQALEKKEIYLKYQPLIDNQSEVYGFEALARWASPVLGAISPEVFISNAEENYLIIPIGTWILEEACKMQVALRKIFDQEFVISVNVSLIQIMQSDYVKVVKKIIKDTDINPNYLTLELTESIFINSTVALDEKIDQLHAIGVKFSLDDFGTGYASLSYLRNIAFDNLKIDKSFIDGILDTKKENRIVGTIIQLVHNLDMKVIAEGVEYKNQYEYLKQISCDVFQGFLMSQPLTINEAVSFVNQFYKVAKNKRVDVLAMQREERGE